MKSEWNPINSPQFLGPGCSPPRPRAWHLIAQWKARLHTAQDVGGRGKRWERWFHGIFYDLIELINYCTLTVVGFWTAISSDLLYPRFDSLLQNFHHLVWWWGSITRGYICCFVFPPLPAYWNQSVCLCLPVVWGGILHLSRWTPTCCLNYHKKWLDSN